KRITEIPAPPFKEKIRAEFYQKRMQELGFKDAATDSEGNVIALRKGTGGGRPKLVVSAHLDTVFPEGTDVTVKEKDGAIVAPGIGDDSRGLAAMLSLIKVMNENQIATVGDIMFVGTVGEEELGNLRGVKALFRDHTDIDGFISIDGLGITRVVNQATGSHRYEFTFKGPGGHSFQEFGLPSAIHAMGRAIAKISELQPPSDPKTTFTVGTVTGGTSVNAIAAEARMAVDMRSNSTDELAKLEARLLDLVKEAVADENARWNSDKMTVEAKLIGDRPAGIVAMDSDRAGDPARGHVSHPGTARDLCRLVHRFQYRDVARHSRRHHRRRRGRRQLALAQRVVQACERLAWPAERAFNGPDADRPRWRDKTGADGPVGRQIDPRRPLNGPQGGSGTTRHASDWTNYRQIAVKAVAEHVPR
ncbi:MAG: M20/M25/M40 family metallo-hydrolase, partial [Tardiphaga sp.]